MKSLKVIMSFLKGLFGLWGFSLFFFLGINNLKYVSIGNRRGRIGIKRKVLILYFCGYII